MSEELKPCPACGASVRLVGGNEWHDRNHFVIRCENSECGCVRIGDTEREECVRRWNNLPRSPHITPNDADCAGCPERRDQGLVWMKEPPTVPGWYWYIQRGSYLPCIVQLVYLDFDTDRLKALFAGIEDDEYVENMDGWWAGPIPIPMPKEPVS